MGKSVTDVQRWSQFPTLSVLLGLRPPIPIIPESLQGARFPDFLPRWKGVLSLLPESHTDAKDLAEIFQPLKVNPRR